MSSDYIMMPGARLDIVGGKPYETLGATHPACCAPCRAGAGRCRALGTDAKPAVGIPWIAVGLAGYALLWFASRRAGQRRRTA